ncbi:uroporphyrinogen decarboxylase family protein [Methanohalophilus mahii]|uniref:Methyltransferase cognate corrinoid protein n=1 Tax=Methanohalophilus mahii (strain ATCC 35705 / DSM 5219 / SLP) TaxID=547558 RepID=D5E740_METMS|nr:uroporphyrinogen decarboxylase family protein [Methanohalophilus mahii]ADE36978.1 methyltransferase cognate corrinoid protein [Methanohalophilus mahii DSM 5219]
MAQDILKELAEAVVSGNKDLTAELSEKALKEGLDPHKAIIDGLAKGMVIVSDNYEKGTAFVPHLLIASQAMYAGMDVLTPHIETEESSKPATMVIGTVEGDVHDIGKNLVKTMMSAGGIDTIDLGNDVPLDKFIETARENQADVISMSALMTTTMSGMEKVIEMLQEEGLRDSLIVMVGGAPISEDFAENIGADKTAPDALHASNWAIDAVSKLSPSKERWSDEKINLAKVKYREILAKKQVKSKKDIGRETAKQIMEEFESVGVKSKEEMSHADRTLAAMADKKVDRLPVYPLACGALRKFADATYKEYAIDPNKFAESAFLGCKYMDLDMFVGLIDLSATSADFGCTIKYPEEDTPSSEGHLEDYEDIETPEVKEGTRAYELIEASKLAKDKLNKELGTPFVGFHEGPLLTLTQLMGADRVLMDMKTNPDVVLEALQKCTDYVCQVSEAFFEEDACDALCVDNLWSNNIIMDEEDYWKFDGKFVYDQHIPVFKKYDQPYIIHNCADAVHFDTQIKKFGTALFSYAYYESEREKGSQNYADLIPKYGDMCCMMGEINPIDMMDNSPEGIQKIENDTEVLLKGVHESLKENGMQSKYVMSTGCETPPGGPMTPIKAMVDKVKELGPQFQKDIIG